MNSMLFKNGYCVVIEVSENKTRIAPYRNYRPANTSRWADNTGKKVSPAIWVDSAELSRSSEMLSGSKIDAIKAAAIKLAE